MSGPELPPWQKIMEKNTPELLKAVTGLQQKVMTEGALSVKTKTLMMMLCDALLTHHDGVASIAKRARALGASEAEIAETVAMAFMMGGVPALVTATNAFRD